MTILEDLDLNPEKMNDYVDLLYRAGGINPGSYGFISSGYGGGLDQDQFFDVLFLRGVLFGMQIVDPLKAQKLMAWFNEQLMAKYPDEVTPTTVPFINLDLVTT